MENIYINLKLKDLQIKHHCHIDILKLYSIAICQDKTEYKVLRNFWLYICVCVNVHCNIVCNKKLEVTFLSINKALNNIPLLGGIIQLLKKVRVLMCSDLE